jgi:hypothetical protein
VSVELIVGHCDEKIAGTKCSDVTGTRIDPNLLFYRSRNQLQSLTQSEWLSISCKSEHWGWPPCGFVVRATKLPIEVSVRLNESVFKVGLGCYAKKVATNGSGKFQHNSKTALKLILCRHKKKSNRNPEIFNRLAKMFLQREIQIKQSSRFVCFVYFAQYAYPCHIF